MVIRLVVAAMGLLAVAGNPRAEPLFVSDWAVSLKKFPGSWSALHAMDSSRMRASPDPTGPERGTVVLVEVHPGDKVGGWSGERAEVCAMRSARGTPLPVRPGDGREFYAVSIKPDSDWQGPQRNAAREIWGTFFQLHGPDRLRASPSVALMAEKDFHVNLCAGDLLDGGRRTEPRSPVSYPFRDGSLNPGAWTEFLLDIVWAPDASGSIAIYRRSGGGIAWTKVFEKLDTATLQYEGSQPVEDHYWKAGFYRSESAMVSRLWLGPIVRGGNREEVARAAFGRP